MFRDKDSWRKIMTRSDNEFVDYIEEQNRIFGKGLDVFRNSDFRGSYPINEQYVMNNWSDFKNRAGWSKDKWYTEINTYHEAFMHAKVGGKKNVLDILNSVEKQLVKAGIDESEAQGRMGIRLEVLLNSDPAAFNLSPDSQFSFFVFIVQF